MSGDGWQMFDAERGLEVRPGGGGRWELRRADQPDRVAVVDDTEWDMIRGVDWTAARRLVGIDL